MSDNQNPSNHGANQNLPQLSFKPASGNINDLIDLNELFADEFYPTEVDFNRLVNGEDLPVGIQYLSPDMSLLQMPRLIPMYDGIGMLPYSAMPLPPQYPTQFVAAFPHNPYYPVLQPSIPYPQLVENSTSIVNENRSVYTEKNDVIMIPPTLPKSLPVRASSSSVGGGSNSSVRSDDEDDVKSAKSSGKGGKSVGKTVGTRPGDESGDNQRFERRERNREHAKRSRIRKKLLLDSLQDQLLALRQENFKLRRVVAERIPHHAAKILNECTTAESKLLAGETDDSLKDASELIPSSLKPSPLTSNIASNLINSVSSSSLQQAKPVKQNAKILMEPDYRLIHSLVNSQQNFVLSDPSLPDNPIVYASEGFCKMTGYKRHEVLGRNCRFLQGPGTDQAAVDIIRKGITEGRDISVCLLNYKADGTPFWNQFFLAALRDGDGNVVNYVGVQCEVNTIPVLEIKDRVKKLPIPNDL